MSRWVHSPWGSCSEGSGSTPVHMGWRRCSAKFERRNSHAHCRMSCPAKNHDIISSAVAACQTFLYKMEKLSTLSVCCVFLRMNQVVLVQVHNVLFQLRACCAPSFQPPVMPFVLPLSVLTSDVTIRTHGRFTATSSVDVWQSAPGPWCCVAVVLLKGDLVTRPASAIGHAHYHGVACQTPLQVALTDRAWEAGVGA